MSASDEENVDQFLDNIANATTSLGYHDLNYTNDNIYSSCFQSTSSLYNVTTTTFPSFTTTNASRSTVVTTISMPTITTSSVMFNRLSLPPLMSTSAANHYEQFRTPAQHSRTPFNPSFHLNPSLSQCPNFDRDFFFKILPEFNGDHKKLHKFLSICDRYAVNLTEGNHAEFLSIIDVRLIGHAFNKMRFFHACTYAEYREELLKQFSSHKTVAQLYSELSNLKQKRNESVSSYIQRLNETLNTLNDATIENEYSDNLIPSSDTINRVMSRNEKIARDAFVYGLRDPLSSILISCRFENLLECTTFAEQQDRILSQKRTGDFSNWRNSTSNRHKSSSSSESSSTSSTSVRHKTSSAKRKSYPSSKFCNYCKYRGHTIEDCYKRPANKQNTKNPFHRSNQNNRSNEDSQPDNRSQSDNISKKSTKFKPLNQKSSTVNRPVERKPN